MKLFKKTGSKSLTFKPENKTVNFDKEANLLDLALKSKVSIDHSCGGSGSCGTCRVRIIKGLERLESRGDVEQAMADDRGFTEEERLACQIEPVDGLIVEIPS